MQKKLGKLLRRAGKTPHFAVKTLRDAEKAALISATCSHAEGRYPLRKVFAIRCPRENHLEAAPMQVSVDNEPIWARCPRQHAPERPPSHTAVDNDFQKCPTRR